eukprot:TRINITY_DN449_c0_g1_i17.p1 TRINITY_DN449_c0_g1~~TRINITY_DN449_c0_g1_i17.p1  ORF type:complete len:383 (-),score=66.47 TRINITY_DN449_c0_g1_i17:149-1297(-)
MADLNLLDSSNFDTLSFIDTIPNEAQREHYTWLLVMHMYHRLGLVKEFNISENNLFRFAGTICKRYRNVPFHNWYHAFNVAQTLFFLLTTCECMKLLKPLELLALFTAALCHDADHPGLNNVFHSKANTRVAFLHKKSTLENHHFLHAMSVLSLAECNIFSNLKSKKLQKVQVYIRDIILATDLSLHNIILDMVETHSRLLAKKFSRKKTPKLTQEEKIVMMCCLMKCSDLSNEIRPSFIADRWAKRVNEEFSAQSALEKKLGLPLTPWIDPDKIIMEKEQINFINGLCLPLYQLLQQVVPPVDLCVHQLHENLLNWQHRLQKNHKPVGETDRSVFSEDQLRGTGRTLTDQLSALASVVGFNFSSKKLTKQTSLSVKAGKKS